MHPLGEKYLRKALLPSIFCPGCGTGTVMNNMLRVVDKLGGIDNFLFISGIGCSGWVGPTIHGDEIHTLHGRTLPVAAGLKAAQPDKHLIIFSGDGDGSGIGGNHLIHAARRNLNITMVLINNYNYGMTGGQVSPATPKGKITKTTPYGNPDQPFDLVKLVSGAGATFVARETSTQPRRLMVTLEKAILHQGFSFIDVICQCPTHAGRNFFGSNAPAVIFEAIKEQAIPLKTPLTSPEQFHVGIF